MENSGESDLVNYVAQTQNNAYVSQLAALPEVVSWLDESGLTAEEAGRIQPTYGPCGNFSNDCLFADPNYARLPGIELRPLRVVR